MTTTGHPPRIPIAFCITDLAVGGAERCLTDIATGLDSARWRPMVYSLAARPLPPHDRLACRLESAGIPVHFLDAKRARDFPRTERRLRRYLRDDLPLILQSFLFHANMVSRFAGWGAGVPHIVAGVRVAEQRRNWHLALDRTTSWLVEKYVCVSQSVADFTASSGIDPAKLVVIPNGVELAPQPALDQPPSGLPNRRLMVFVGRLDPQKRVDWLLRRAARFLPQLPEHDLLIVGDGPLADDLQALSRQLNIADRVHFLCFRDDARRIIQVSELLVLASAWEGMPNVVLEAMACGKPVVCTAAEGVEELLGPLTAQQAVPVDAEQRFVERVVAIAANRELQSSLASQNYHRVRSDFSLSQMIARYASFYEQLLLAPGASSGT